MNIHVPNSGSLRHNTEMEILESPLEWLRAFQEGWLAHMEKTGEKDWGRYTHPQNRLTPNAKGIDLSRSRLMLITSAGAYHPESQPAFNGGNALGDYSIRLIPTNMPVDQMAFTHPIFEKPDILEADPQTLLPLDHLSELVAEGEIGGLAPFFISFNGYQPHAIRVVKELVPAILNAVKVYEANAALIIPVGSLCIQSAGLIARALEVNYIPTTLTTWNADMAFLTAPPRLTATHLPEGHTMGMPGNHAQQKRILNATLKLLEMNAPTGIVYLNETAES